MKIYDIFEDEDSLADYLDKSTWSWQGGFSIVWDLECMCGGGTSCTKSYRR